MEYKDKQPSIWKILFFLLLAIVLCFGGYRAYRFATTEHELFKAKYRIQIEAELQEKINDAYAKGLAEGSKRKLSENEAKGLVSSAISYIEDCNSGNCECDSLMAGVWLSRAHDFVGD